MGRSEVRHRGRHGCLEFAGARRTPRTRVRDLASQLIAVVQRKGPCLFHGDGHVATPRCTARLRQSRGSGGRRAAWRRDDKRAIEDSKTPTGISVGKALTGRPALLTRAEMPLACNTGGVARALNSSPSVTLARLERVRRARDDDCGEPQPLRIPQEIKRCSKGCRLARTRYSVRFSRTLRVLHESLLACAVADFYAPP